MGRLKKTIIATDACPDCKSEMGFCLGVDRHLYGTCPCGCKRRMNAQCSNSVINKCIKAGTDIDDLYLKENGTTFNQQNNNNADGTVIVGDVQNLNVGK